MTTAIQLVKFSTAELEERAARAAEEEDACQQENIEQFHRLMAAGGEPGFSGDLRRAIHGNQLPLDTVSAATGIEVGLISEFLQGTAELTSGQVAAIVQYLNLQLVRPIPATPAPRVRKPT